MRDWNTKIKSFIVFFFLIFIVACISRCSKDSSPTAPIEPESPQWQESTLPPDLIGDWYLGEDKKLSVSRLFVNVVDHGKFYDIGTVDSSGVSYRLFLKDSDEDFITLFMEKTGWNEWKISIAVGRIEYPPVNGWYKVKSSPPWKELAEPVDILGEWREKEGTLAVEVFNDSVVFEGQGWNVSQVQSNGLVRRFVLKKGSSYRALYWRNVGNLAMEAALNMGIADDPADEQSLDADSWVILHTWVDAIDYFPLAVGAKWIYYFDDGSLYVLIIEVLEELTAGEDNVFLLEQTYYRYANPEDKIEGPPDMSDTASTFDLILNSSIKIRKQRENLIIIDRYNDQELSVLIKGGFDASTNLYSFLKGVLYSSESRNYDVQSCVVDLLNRAESCVFFEKEFLQGSNVHLVRGLGIFSVNHWDTYLVCDDMCKEHIRVTNTELVAYIPGDV